MSISLSNGHAWPPFGLSEPDDPEVWGREELEAMNAIFVAALEEAFRSGREHRASACTEFRVARGSPAVARARAKRLVEEARWGVATKGATYVAAALAADRY